MIPFLPGVIIIIIIIIILIIIDFAIQIIPVRTKIHHISLCE